MTSEMRNTLTQQYGQHRYDYPHLSDFNIRSVIRKHRCKTYADLDHWCSRLDRIVAEIEEMKARMKP